MSFRGAFSVETEEALAGLGIIKATTEPNGAPPGGPHDPSVTTVWIRARSEGDAIAWVRTELVEHGSFSDFSASRVLVPIRMTLLENAYDFLNESLWSTIRAEEDARAWKFAVFAIVQAIELLLKARLEAEHPILVYRDVDVPRNTVSLRQAIGRIENVAKIELTERERRPLRKALDWRDRIVHHEFEMSPYEVEVVYVQLFEFLVGFHDEHTDFGSLHDKIDEELWEQEAELFEFFRREFVNYRGVEVAKNVPAEIVRAQEQSTIWLYGREWDRIRFGEEPGYDEPPACYDCAIKSGEIHLLGCDWEVCPRCFGQLLGCGCVAEDGPADDALPSREAAADEARAWMRTRADDDE